MYQLYNYPYLLDDQILNPLNQYYLDHNLIERQMPPIEPNRLMKSAEFNKTLILDIEVINEQLRTSRPFAERIQTAAQQSDHQTVHNLINDLPIQNRALVSYSPGGLSVTLVPKRETNNCCYMVFYLNWKESF